MVLHSILFNDALPLQIKIIPSEVTVGCCGIVHRSLQIQGTDDASWCEIVFPAQRIDNLGASRV